MAQWIWKFGEYEMYHNLLLHQRRTQYGSTYTSMWKLYPVEPSVRFRKQVTLTEPGTFTVRACGQVNTTVRDLKAYHPFLGRKEYGDRKIITLEPGEYEVEISVVNGTTFPCCFVEGCIESDASWMADDMTVNRSPVGTYDHFTDPEKTPETFPFAYEPLPVKESRKVGDGVLFDFGKETFAAVTIENLSKEKLMVQYGESEEEALDPVWSVIHFEAHPVNGVLEYPPYGFRYVYVEDPEAKISATYEYNPITYKASFTCDEERINQVWQTAAYTYHLNAREFLLDGIKRDRWVWSGDAYQSYFVSQALFFDKELEQRTLIALGGKKPFAQHMNTIMDYTFFWIIGLWEHYQIYGDKDFLEQMKPQLKEIMAYCRGRVSEDGFVREMPGDWIFIDWADMDKNGALCGEQILFAAALRSYARILETLGEADPSAIRQADDLKQQILEKFYDPEKQVFIDSYESGKRNVTRHSNLLAYLYLGISDEMKQGLYQRVVLNDEVPAITTPYFKFYENMVHCEAGNRTLLEESLRTYYGTMLDLGATTLYEQFDPNKTSVERFAMYGHPYEMSACHAWSAGLIHLLNRYRLGVKNTGIAYSSFEVRPNPGDLKTFDGTVPVPGGVVRVALTETELRVTSDIPGGTLYWKGTTLEIPVKERIVLPC